MQDRKPDLILASESDAERYNADGSFSGLPEALAHLKKHPIAIEQLGKNPHLDHIHLSISSKHRHLVQWTGRGRTGWHYPIGEVMVISNAAHILYPNSHVKKSLTTADEASLR